MTAAVEALPKRRGLKPGQRHSGQFRKGFDPKRGQNGPARRSLLEEVSTAAAEHAEGAIAFLADTYKNSEANLKLRIVCAQELLSRGCGTPVSMQVHKMITEDGQEAGKGRMHQLASLPSVSLSDAELTEFLVGTKAQRVNAAYDDIEDAQFEELPNSDRMAANKAAK